MKVFRNRFYDDAAAARRQRTAATYVVACEADQAPETPDNRWVPATGRLLLDGLTHLYTENGVRYWGHL